MKKILILVFFIAASFTLPSAKAQEVFSKGSGVLNASIGLGNAFYGGLSNYRTTLPPLAVSYEVGVVDGLIDGNASIGIGGYLGISASRSRFVYAGQEYGTSYTNIVLGPRGVFHYQFIENLDTYAGVLLGANIVGTSNYGNSAPGYSSSGGGVVFDAFFGARYYLSPNVAVMAELGYGISYLNIGAAFRLQ